MAAQEGRRRAVVRIVAGIAAILLLLGFVQFVQTMMSLKTSKAARQVQTIQIIRPPPPPPPPPDQPPPPPPEKVEQPLPQDQPEPKPDEAQEQAPDTLANDGPAAAGGDAFGMHQGSGGFIGGTGTAPFAWYTNRLRDLIKDKLANTSCVKSAKGSISTRIVVATDGRVKQIQLLTTTGNPRLDDCLDKALASINRVGADAPSGMPEAVNLKVVF
jgi:protein TonB